MSSSPESSGKLAAAPIPWLSSGGFENDVVLAIRLELARNLTSHPFPRAAHSRQRFQLRKLLAFHFQDHPPGDGTFLTPSGEEEEGLLSRLCAERWLHPPGTTLNSQDKTAWLSTEQSTAILINHEEHIRICAFASGLELEQPLGILKKTAALLNEKLPVAFSSNLGYLTSCPDRLGSGLRTTALLHLPGLVMTRQIEPVLRAAQQLQLKVEGGFGQGKEVSGHFFEITKPAKGEKQTARNIADIHQVLRQLIRSERRARRKLGAEHKQWLYDYVGRSYGILRYGRRLSEKELFRLLSALRLGVLLEMFSSLKLAELAELPVRLADSHLYALNIRQEGKKGGAPTQEALKIKRSEKIRSLLRKNGT